MCRFFGSVGNSIIDRDSFAQLLELSRNGGPDASTIFQDEHIQFGFNRLAILDTSELGNQPFVSESGRYVLMLNGEIYNYRELEKEYEITGLKSGSDAEVVLRLIEKLSFEKVIHVLNGMFAIACWDAEVKQLYLARDFAGIKPLFYSIRQDGMVFGSQFDQLLQHPWCKDWKFSEVGLSEYLQFGYMSPPYTIADKVKQLGVGEYLSYSFNSQEIKTVVYKTFYGEEGSISELASGRSKQLGEVIAEAVERQMVSDVPLGVFLSGGIDSSLVAAKAKTLKSDISAITIGFEDKKYDESETAMAYAKQLGIKNHHIERFGNQELLGVFEEHFEAMSEPIADYSTLPTFLVSKIARETNTVMLSGDGGDELFWGYPRFLTFANSAKYFRIPSTFMRNSVKRVLKSAKYNVSGFLGEDSLGAANRSFHSYISPTDIFSLTGKYSISEETIGGYDCDAFSGRKSLNYLRKNEFYFHLQKILVKVDRMSMGNALEVRVPLLDEKVIEFSEKYYSRLGSEHSELKRMLKEALYPHIPKEILEVKKRGFTPPLYEWSMNELKSEITETVIRNPLSFDSAVLNKWLQEYYSNSGRVSIEKIWTVYVLIKWLEKQTDKL
jgi:asparagine synthase (glutamine-hydrolysing)